MFLNYVIALLSLLLYLHGFFPIPARPLEKTFPNNITETNVKPHKTIIVIIDALRLDFITEATTPFISQTFKKNGCFSHLTVVTPTVTLPRIKAITTGNIPQFIDIILNLASPTKVEDSFIHQAHAKGKRIVFYGDDIWVKLFPEEFIRSEGVSSFFVNDYTEVDDNVTRNVREEMDRTDWDIMILHYLGLDHIGHVYGPKSPLILQKLTEMDQIISEIYNKMEKDTLFVITGDHGMRDSGGHGGSTYPETNVPLVIIGTSCINSTFAQIDIPANLAILLGFDIPATSIGELQRGLLTQLPLPVYLDALKYNTFVVQNKLDLCGEEIDTAQHLHELFQLNKDQKIGTEAANMYETCTKRISERLQKSSVQQNIWSLLIATFLGIIILLKIIQNRYGVYGKNGFEEIVMLAIVSLQFIDFNSPVLATTMVLLLMVNLKRLKVKVLDINYSFLTVLSVIHPLTFLSSSFLEEEHQFLYFFMNTFVLFNLCSDKRKSWAILLGVLRFIRTINQVGDKWAAEPDLADWLLKNENYIFLQTIFIFGLVFSLYGCGLYTTKIGHIIDVVFYILIYVYKVFLNENVILGRILWLVILLKFLRNEGFLTTWILIITLLLKPYNVVLIPVCIFTSRLFKSKLKTDQVIVHWWLGNLLFFAQGHDNSLASVDISSGYIGLSEYNPLFVIPQVLCHTYAFPVLSHLLLFTNNNINVKKSLSIFLLFRLYTVVVVFIVTFIHRHHLFVWSVFAPKMFVEASHLGFLFIEISCYYMKDLINKVLF